MFTPPPPPSSPERRVFHELSPSDRNRLHIRLVPYSPPHLSPDDSASAPAPPPPRPVFYTDDSPPPPVPSKSRARDSGERAAGPAVSSLGSPERARSRTATDLSLRASSSAFWTSLSNSPSPLPSEPQSPASSPSSSPLPPRRRRKVISLNADNTFSLISEAESGFSAIKSFRSPTKPPSIGSYDRSPAQSPLHKPSPTLSPPFRPPLLGQPDAASSFNWNHVPAGGGGVRTVPHGLSNDNKTLSDETPGSWPSYQPPPLKSGAQSRHLTSHLPPWARPSLRSPHSASTLSETSNYKTFAHSSPDLPAASSSHNSAAIDLDNFSPSSPHHNVYVLGETSSEQSTDDQTRPGTGQVEANYLVHGDPSPLSSPAAGFPSQLGSGYSSESLSVPPLRLGSSQRSFTEQTGRPRPQALDTLRTPSLASLTSLLVDQVARSLFASTATMQVPGATVRKFPRRSANATTQQPPWSPAPSMVVSESDVDGLTLSRSVSRLSSTSRRSHRRLHSSHGAEADIAVPPLPATDAAHIRRAFAAPASLNGSMAEESRSSSHRRKASNGRRIRNHDEHGDGLADLEEMHRRPSRPRHYNSLSSYSSDRNLRSAGSTRSNSFSQSSLPTWARLYYGSGERRLLPTRPSTDSLFSQFTAGSQAESVRSPALSTDRIIAPDAFSRLPEERATRDEMRLDGGEEVLEPISPAVRNLRQQTSSIWSPHLGRDRGQSKYGMWQPPSTIWSTEGTLFRRRNVQPIMFVIGFILPLTWIVASFLPLPPKALSEMVEGPSSQSRLHLEHDQGLRVEVRSAVDARYRKRAQWWRNVNRAMSVVAIIILGAVVALVVTGVQRRWAI